MMLNLKHVLDSRQKKLASFGELTVKSSSFLDWIQHATYDVDEQEIKPCSKLAADNADKISLF